ncbi:MAG: hypothetical protein GY932_00995 [Arcobacter sp.]|nr:hypothetical protein [Arcobacter sp.]
MELLRKSDLNVNFENNEGNKAISFAIINKNFNIYKIIKKHTTDINKKNETLLHLAIKHENIEVIDDLFNDANFIMNDEILFYNKTYRSINIINRITKKFNNLKAIDSNNRGVLFYVVENGYESESIFLKLLDKGLDINLLDKDGNHIIYKYMKEKQEFKKEKRYKDYHNNLQTIIMMGANVNSKDSFGGITLHKAILDCDIITIKLLLHSGADVNAIDNRGRNIIHNAVWKNDMKIFKLIYAYNKTLLNEPDKFGVTAINYAAFLGYTELVLELIELNAHINNPYKKSNYILVFLKKFHKSLDTIIDEARTKSDKIKLKRLIENMKKEFSINE